jgi:hypothetical protein
MYEKAVIGVVEERNYKHDEDQDHVLEALDA